MKNVLRFFGLIVLCAINSDSIAQITPNGNTGATTTNYTNGSANDPLYIWSADGIGNNTASLTATAPSGTGPFTFDWYFHNSTNASWTPYFSEVAMSSTISTLPSDGYRVQIYDSGSNLVGCYTAWVWNMNTEVLVSDNPTDCDADDLTGVINAESAFTYYNPPPPESLISSATQIDVCFSATHTYVSDLAFYLIGPPSCGSPVIALSPNPGAIGQGSICNSGNNISNLCFSTSSVNNLDVCSAAAPLSGTYGSYGSPATTIDWSNLIGCNAASGGWTVQIYDCIGADYGALTNAEITFSNLTSFCGSPTSITYSSGAINSAINDNSCDAGTASIFQVPVSDDLTTPIDVSATVSYAWSADNGVSVPNPSSDLNPSLTNLPVGTTEFTLTATIDYNGVFGVNQDSVLFISNCCSVIADAGNDVVICSGESETIGTPGLSGYTYSWNSTNGLDDPMIAEPTVSLTNATSLPITTTYTLTATNVDDGGCFQDFQVDVTVNPMEDATFTVADFCPGATNNATITGTSGGAFAFNPAVADGATIDATSGAITNGVGGTTYTVEYTTSGTCPATSIENVAVHALPTVDGNDASICIGESVILSGTGADTYVWSDGVTDGVSFTPGATQTYTVTGTDANGCTNTGQAEVVVNVLPDVDAGMYQSVCNGENVTLSASGADTYNWDNGVTDNVSFTASTTTLYTVTGTDANGCINSDTVTIIVNPNIPVDAGMDQEICIGESVVLTATGTPITTWTSGITNGDAVSPSVTTTYEVTGESVNGCITTDQVTVTVNPLPTINAGADQTICEGDQVTLSGTGGVSYSWDNGVSNSGPFSPSGTAMYTVSGTDANGCVNVDSVEITVLPVPLSSMTGNPLTGVAPLIVDFTNESTNATSFVWNFGNGDSNVETDLSSQSTTYTTPGTYTVSLTASNGFCEDVSTLEVVVLNLPDPIVTPPNVITPNGDLDNDHWFIKTQYVESLEVVIVNRWGNVVSEFEGVDGYWDGTTKGKECADGVYFYRFTAVGVNGKEVKGHGNITLIRE